MAYISIYLTCEGKDIVNSGHSNATMLAGEQLITLI